MWLLGAGASVAAGIPTWDMIWECKQQLYVSRRRVSPKLVADLVNPAVRRELQSFIDDVGNLAMPGAPDEYAALFEAVYPSEADRRTYIASKVGGAKPSYGHLALATLMRGGRVRLVWTTNFDPLIADGCAKVYGGTAPMPGTSSMTRRKADVHGGVLARASPTAPAHDECGQERRSALGPHAEQHFGLPVGVSLRIASRRRAAIRRFTRPIRSDSSKLGVHHAPENANLTGLAAAYIIQQMADLKAGHRVSSVQQRAPTQNLSRLAEHYRSGNRRRRRIFFVHRPAIKCDSGGNGHGSEDLHSIVASGDRPGSR